jgi:penicillin-binding protein 2
LYDLLEHLEGCALRKLILALLAFSLVLSACGNVSNGTRLGTTPELPDPVQTTESAPNPDDTARQFLEAWKVGDYAGMYQQLSDLTQDDLSLEAFTERYKDVMRSAAITSLDYQVVSSLIVSPQRAEVRFRITLTSAAVGDIIRENRIDLSRLAGEPWRIAWTDAAILPELEGGNQLSLATITPTRANIYDRNNRAFAAEATADQPNAAALWIVPNQIGDEEAEDTMLSTLRRLFDLAIVDPILERYDAIRNTDYFTPLGVAPYDDYFTVGGLLGSLGGVQASWYSTRYYTGSGLTPFGGGIAPHAVGYVSQIQEAELEDYLARGYQGDEFVGRIGIERVFEDELRGVPGGTLYLTDSNGQVLQVLASRDTEPPYAIYTNLDRDLQQIAQQSIANYTGAVVVLERDTGAVLAMASSPGFDPNLFDSQNPNGPNGAFQMLNGANQPYVNRATQGLYPPGSIFKVITMSTAIESGKYSADTIYNCGLVWTEVPGLELFDWRYEKERPAAGEITLQQGLEYSCNPWFYHIGLGLFNEGMPTALSDMAKGFGLGQSTGIEIGDEAGTVPDPEAKLERLGEEWNFRDPVQLAIGQSFLEVTPLQMARIYAALGNGGTLYQPQLIGSIENAEGEVIQTFEPLAQGELPISENTLSEIQQGMVNVIKQPYATAYRRFLGLNLNIAGKTGTATTGEFTESHAWFAGYTSEEREDKPDIAIAVILENQGEGSDWGAPIFRRIVETYFFGRPLQLFPWEARLWVEKTPEPEEEGAEETPTP